MDEEFGWESFELHFVSWFTPLLSSALLCLCMR